MRPELLDPESGLLARVTAVIQQTAVPSEALAAVLRLLCEALDWSLARALVAAADSDRLHQLGAWCVVDQAAPEALAAFQQALAAQGVRRGEGLCGRALAESQPQWLSDLGAVADVRVRGAARAAGLNAAYAFPLGGPDQTIGVLAFHARTFVAPEPELLAIMAAIGPQLAEKLTRRIEQEQLRAVARQARDVVAYATDAIVAMDRHHRIIEWNHAATELFGWTADEALGRTVTETIVPPQHREAQQQGVARVLATGLSRLAGGPIELTALHKDGREFPIELTLWSFQEAGDWRFYASIRDITDRAKLRRALERRAYYDSLTGLANRSLILERLNQLLQRSEPHGHGVAVLFVDLDRFKQINDSIGHDAGDRVLRAVAERFRQAVRPDDIVARLAGDEFLVVCSNVENYRAGEAVADRVLAALENPVHVTGENVFLTASVGVVLAGEDSTAEALIASADVAMYRAKQSGRARYARFDQKARQLAIAGPQLERELRTALQDGQLRLYYQPIVHADTGSIATIEALLRWQHPTRGLLLPRDFMPVAEESGLIAPIGMWVLEEACRSATQWNPEGGPEVRVCVAVNLSARQLAQAGLSSAVGHVLAAANVDPHRVEFGIDVSAAVAAGAIPASTDTLDALRALGARLCIDDFGSECSSFAYLKHVDVNALKVDLSFVQQIATSPVDRAIVEAVANLGRTLGLDVVAKGVETETQAQALRAAGVNLLQGFLYGRPQPQEELLRMLGKT